MAETTREKIARRKKEQAEARESRNSPKTDDSTNIFARAEDTILDIGKQLPHIASSAANMITAGATGGIERDVRANFDQFMDYMKGQNPDKQYPEYHDEATAARQQREADNPISTIIGDVGGAVAGGASGLIKGALKQGMKALPRYATVAGIGAAENVGAEAGKGKLDSIMDTVGAGILGAAGAAGGQAVGETLSPVADTVHRYFTRNPEVIADASSREVKAGLQGKLKGTTPGNVAGRTSRPDGIMDDVYNDAGNLKNNQTLADTDPRLRAEAERAIGMSDPAKLGPTRDLAEARLAAQDDEAAALTKRYIRPHSTKGESAADMDRRLETTRAEYGDMVKSNAFKNVQQADASKDINRAAMNKKVKAAFGDDVGKDEAGVRDWVITQLSGGKGVNNMSPNNLLKVKKKIDEEINLLMRGGGDSKVTTDSLIALGKVKKQINQQLGKTLPDFKRLSGNYASEFDLADMRETGADMFSKTKFDPKQLENYVKSLDGEPIRQQAFVTGALQAMMKRQGTDSVAEIKRVLKPGNNDYDKLAAILPEGQLDAFVEEAGDLIARADTAKGFNSTATAVAKAPPKAAEESRILRTMAGFGSALQGRLGSAAYLSSGAFEDPMKDAITNQIRDLLIAKGTPEAMEQLRTIMDVAPKVSQGRGATVGRVGNAIWD